jgi:hypothetical protein
LRTGHGLPEIDVAAFDLWNSGALDREISFATKASNSNSEKQGSTSLSPPRYDEVKNQSSEHNGANRRHHFHGASPELGHAWFNTADCDGLE